MDINGSEKQNRRFFAIASLGKKRWYWVVWPSLDELQASEIPLLQVGEGVEKTKAEAVEKAWNLAGRYGEWIAAKYAAAHHRNKSGRMQEGESRRFSAAPTVPAAHEFLYRDIYNTETGDWSSMPHRVVRKTRQYVYVERSPYASGELTGSWLDRERPTFRLDRQALEQEGFAFIPLNSRIMDSEDPVFFSSEGIHQSAGQSYKCLEVLQISWPCTTQDVKEAYRRSVKSAHPDGGGDHDRFLALQQAYEQALRLCHDDR